MVASFLFTPKDTLAALDAQSHFAYGNQYLAKHQYSEAIIEYQKALKLNPYYKEAYLNLGKAYQSKQLFKEAISQYQKALQLDKGYVSAYVNLGLCYEKQNLLAKAKINIKKAIELDPVNPEAHFNLATVLYKENRIKESIEEYIQATKIDSSYLQAYIKLGDIYFKNLNNDKKALYYFDMAKKIDPKNEISYLKSGEVYVKKELFNKAILEYQKAVTKNPKNPLTLAQFGLLYLTIGKYHQALTLYKELASLTPDNPLVHYTLAVTYEKLGMFEEALNKFEIALSLAADDEVASFHQERIILELNRANVSSVWRKKSSEKHLISAKDYLNEGFLTLATYELKRSILLDPQNPNTRLSLAKLYELLGRKQLSIEELIKTIELDPNNLDAKDRLEKLYFEYESSLASKEKITKEQIPPSEINLLVSAYTTNSIHFGIEEVALRMLLPLLKQFPQISLIDKIFILKDENKIINIGRNLKADLALNIKINETEEMIEITANLIDLKTMKKLLNIYLPIKGKSKLIKGLSFLAEKVIKAVPLEGVIMKITDDKVIINMGKIHGLKPKQILEVWKRESKLEPFSQKIKGPEAIGKIEILVVEPEISKAKIITPRTLRLIGLNDIVKLPATKKKK